MVACWHIQLHFKLNWSWENAEKPSNQAGSLWFNLIWPQRYATDGTSSKENTENNWSSLTRNMRFWSYMQKYKNKLRLDFPCTSNSHGSMVKQGLHSHLLCRVCSRDTDWQSDILFWLSLSLSFSLFFSLPFSLPPTQLSDRPCLTPESTLSFKCTCCQC